MKTIVINGKTWRYKVGKQNTVIESVEPEFKFSEKNYIIKDLDAPYDFERGQYKKSGDGMILPSDIKSYINNNGHDINEKYLKSIGKICLCAECADR